MKREIRLSIATGWRQGETQRSMRGADFSSPFPGAAQGGSPESPVTASCRREMIKRVLMRFKSAAFAFANPYEFSKPADQGEVIARIQANSKRFAMVYAVLFAPFLLNMMTSDTWLQLGVIISAGLWVFGYYVKPNEENLFGIPFPKFYTCAALSAAVLFLTGMLGALLSALLKFSIVALPHMSLHTAASADALSADEVTSFSPTSF